MSTIPFPNPPCRVAAVAALAALLVACSVSGPPAEGEHAPSDDGATSSGSNNTSDGPTSTTATTGGTTGSNDPGVDDSCQAEGPFPAPHWQPGDPQSHGLDPSKLELAAQYASENKSNCLVVIRNGELVFERYFQGTTPETKVKSWSVGKSYASTVAGIALDRGDLSSVHDPIADYVPQLAGGPKAPITLHDLMSMASGLYMNLMADNVGITGAEDMSLRALEWDVTHPPGQLWEYNNHAVQLLEPVIRSATGKYADAYAQEHLWEPLGMNAEWMKDKVGHPAMYMNVLASCRDHAKLGYLFLKRGCWNGRQVVSEQWVKTATSSSQAMSPGYGYWWWLSGESPTLDSTDFSELPGGSLHPFGPDDSFCAVGLGSQVIEVIPSLDMVMVRMGTAPQDDPLAWLTPLKMLQALVEDGKQVVHNKVLELVLDAVVQ